MILKETIKLDRLLLSILITFVIADIYPHPNLAPGLVQSTFERIARN